MNANTLLADAAAIEIENFVSGNDSITIVVRSIQRAAHCPQCREPSSSLKMLVYSAEETVYPVTQWSNRLTGLKQRDELFRKQVSVPPTDAILRHRSFEKKQTETATFIKRC